MKAEIISVGTEIILGNILNTNTNYLSKKLWEIGIDVLYHTSIKDDPKLLKEVLNIGLERSDLLIFTGGLGPTSDDMTKEIVCKTLGIEMELNKRAEEDIKEYFNRLNKPMTYTNIKQAYLPKGAKHLINEIGTAPGVYIEYGSRRIVLLPGPPKEMALMFNKYVVPLIKQDYIIKVKTINTIGIGESTLETVLADLIGNQNPTVATYAKEGLVDIKIVAKGHNTERVNFLLDEMVGKISSRISEFIYSYEDEKIEEVIVNKLRRKKIKIAICESCTGGLITSKLTRVPGASEVLERGIVTYSNISKIEEVGVKRSTLERYGAVSKEVALEMARGLYDKTNVDIAVSTTGIAGPTGGSELKPVGLVFMSIVTKDNSYVIKSIFNGDRESIQNRASIKVFDELRKIL
ncbi:competence/damage-inducible protein A [Tepidimicrobium xylanilyticum]|uniref:Putative competence-damage inducible protein n=1 Tax=Tepidimicrobium xylanilyticum TaxID=1123352 RepID=A0A1H2YB20_9FIRM|nr:competence/damage-inducible protein A [Tepidimicrobium xylanilyticum]GMG97081.1 putative competence-damage inducible protein [Tepidimicrobium xylanilyticum]SDX01749.1 competence/damage-inducible protein cinA [Tepidimicrobium xylanilyticum]